MVTGDDDHAVQTHSSASSSDDEDTDNSSSPTTPGTKSFSALSNDQRTFFERVHE